MVDPDRYPTASGEEPGVQLFATGLDLTRTNFDAMALAGVWWIECKLDGSSFVSAQLGRSRTYLSSWRGCDLHQAALFKTEIENCDLSGARLQKAEMIRVNMSKCDVRECDLSGAAMEGVNFLDCDLRGVRISNTEISRMSLHGSCVTDIDLTGSSGTLTLPYGNGRPYINIATPEQPDWLATTPL